MLQLSSSSLCRTEFKALFLGFEEKIFLDTFSKAVFFTLLLPSDLDVVLEARGFLSLFFLLILFGLFFAFLSAEVLGCWELLVVASPAVSWKYKTHNSLSSSSPRIFNKLNVMSRYTHLLLNLFSLQIQISLGS